MDTAWNKQGEVFLTPDLSLDSLYLHSCLSSSMESTNSLNCAVEAFYSSDVGLQDHSARSVPCNQE